jgi:hypothetical protein
VVERYHEVPELLVLLREEERQRRRHPQGRRATGELRGLRVVARLTGALGLRDEVTP